MIVTLEDLKKLNACGDQVILFRETFGEAVEVSRKNLTRAQGVGLDLNWWGRKIFEKTYDEATAPAQRALDEALALADKAYAEAKAIAHTAYAEAKAIARKAYQEAEIETLLTLAQGNSR